jgi:hypothetical protein
MKCWAELHDIQMKMDQREKPGKFFPFAFTHSLHKLQGEIQNSQALPIPKTIGNLLVGIHLR